MGCVKGISVLRSQQSRGMIEGSLNMLPLQLLCGLTVSVLKKKNSLKCYPSVLCICAIGTVTETHYLWFGLEFLNYYFLYIMGPFLEHSTTTGTHLPLCFPSTCPVLQAVVAVPLMEERPWFVMGMFCWVAMRWVGVQIPC